MKFASYDPTQKLNTIQGGTQASGNEMAYGGNVSGLNAMNKALQDATNTWIEIDKRKDYIDVTNAINEFNNSTNQLLNDDKDGLMNRKGMNAQSILPDYNAGVDKIQREIMGKYKFRTNDAINAFTKAVETSKTTDYNNISKYSRGQYETALSTATQNQITNLRDSAIRSDNMADQMKTITLMGDLYRSTGKELGLDDEQINEKIRANTDETGKYLLDRAVAENDSTRTENLISSLSGVVSESVLTPYKKMSNQMNINKLVNDDNTYAKLYKMYGHDLNSGMNSAAMYVRAKMETQNEEAIKGGAGADTHLWGIAQYISKKYGYNVEMVYRQLFHETGGSANFGKLQTENRNYAGLTQAEPNGEENRQQDGGTNYYKVYKTDEEFADDYVQSFLRHYDGLKDVSDVDTWAHILKANSYYTDSEANYSAGMRNAPMTSSSSPKYSEDQIKKAEDDARAAYKNYFTLQEQTRKIAINDRLQAGQTILNQKIANGDVSGAFQYAQVQLAGATTPEEQEYWSGKMASERPKLDRIYEKGLKMTAQEKWGIKQYAKSHTYEQTRAYAERVLPNKIMDDELDASLLEIDDNNKKASNIDLTPYEYKLADVMPKDKTLAGSFKYGVKQEMAGRIEEFKVKHHRPPTDAEKDEIFDAAVATSTLRSTSKPYFGDGDDYSSTISGASNQAIGIVHAEPVGNHYIRVTYRDGSTQDIYESEYNALQRRYTNG